MFLYSNFKISIDLTKNITLKIGAITPTFFTQMDSDFTYTLISKYARNFVIWCILKYLNLRKYSLLILKSGKGG